MEPLTGSYLGRRIALRRGNQGLREAQEALRGRVLLDVEGAVPAAAVAHHDARRAGLPAAGEGGCHRADRATRPRGSRTPREARHQAARLAVAGPGAAPAASSVRTTLRS